ncbi:FusB/FusC family EF-G-binding protein [Cytobacillus sp. FJAT-54145]|uniref:FusB/FusC family EF-G-binding protein n=1 Tax=Cytobacillus spartinae TaxID=3299023 RepID=A0ABW6K8G3_9BACI
MEPFIRNEQYNFINAQIKNQINGHLSVNDIDVLNALKSLTKEKVLNLFSELSTEQKRLLSEIIQVKDKAGAEEYLSTIHPYVIPFKQVSEQTIKKLFPKVKKMRLPSIEELDFKALSYLGWNDKGTNRKYIIVPHENKLIGIQGKFNHSSHKGICTICNKHEEVGLFTSEKKGAVLGTFIQRGNYICEDSQTCNKNIMNLEKLNDFVLTVK